MENEKGYSELLRYISERTGISQLEYPFLSFSDHSWCSIVAYKDCHTQSELENYYIRLGVQIFLAYYLGTKDLHCENVIASGEYPTQSGTKNSQRRNLLSVVPIGIIFRLTSFLSLE